MIQKHAFRTAYTIFVHPLKNKFSGLRLTKSLIDKIVIKPAYTLFVRQQNKKACDIQNRIKKKRISLGKNVPKTRFQNCLCNIFSPTKK